MLLNTLDNLDNDLDNLNLFNRLLLKLLSSNLNLLTLINNLSRDNSNINRLDTLKLPINSLLRIRISNLKNNRQIMTTGLLSSAAIAQNTKVNSSSAMMQALLDTIADGTGLSYREGLLRPDDFELRLRAGD